MARSQAAEPRDFVAEMRAIVLAECVGTYKAPDKAREIHEKILVTDPDLLLGFGRETLIGTIRDFIGHMNRSQRAQTRYAAARAAVRERFETAVATGNTTALRQAASTNFLGAHFVVNDEGLQMPFGETGKTERMFIISSYQRQQHATGLQIAYHMSVQRKCGNKITSDVFTEEGLAALHQKHVGTSAIAP